MGTTRVVVSFGNQLRYGLVGTRRNEHLTILRKIFIMKEEEGECFHLPDWKDNDQDSENVNISYLSNKEFYVDHIFSHKDKPPYIEKPDDESM